MQKYGYSSSHAYCILAKITLNTNVLGKLIFRDINNLATQELLLVDLAKGPYTRGDEVDQHRQ